MSDKALESFLSEAHAIQHARLPLWARHTVLFMVGILLVGIIWASLGKVDIIVNASGKLVSITPTIVMKPLERGVIRNVHVGLGDRVKKDDVLVTFDAVFSDADRERLANEVRSLEAQYDRLLAEYENRELKLPGDAAGERIVQYKIFQDRKKFYAEKREYFDNELERIRRTSASLKENLALQEKRLASFRDIEGMLNRARSSQAVSPRDFKEAQMGRMQLESEIGDKRNNILVLESELQAKEAEDAAFRSDWRIRISEELIRTRQALTTARKEYDKASQLSAYVELKAPEDAVVHDLTPMSIGSAVREAETLLTLVPLDARLEVEADIRAEDRALVKPGDEARIKISAFPFQKYGTVPGVVRVISEDAFTAREHEPGQGGNSFYRARIELTEGKDGDFHMLDRLIPGMEAQAEIMVGTRRVISYLVNPLIKALDEAIHEP